METDVTEGTGITYPVETENTLGVTVVEDEETVALIAEDIQQPDGGVMTLDDFLGKLICGACSRKCPLLNVITQLIMKTGERLA